MNWGFKSQPQVKWRDDDLVELTAPLVYYCQDGIRVFVVPVGTVSDLESRPTLMPALINWFLGSIRFTAPAALLHDYLYGVQPVSRAEADALYFEALNWLRLNDTDSGRWESGRRRVGQTLAWLGLRVGGWKAWND